jgi:parallel beta-helix repeat protein
MRSLFRPFRQPAAPRGRALTRLALEQLEERTVPATFTVTNLNDSGGGSLRQAILAANAAPGVDTITFKPGLSGTITLTTGEMAISDSAIIAGPGAGIITISGNNASRIFEANGTVGISGLTLTQGNPVDGWGGAIASSGTLVLSGMVITGNRCSGSFGGGGILAGSLLVENSIISGNSAGPRRLFDPTPSGGGIRCAGPATIRNCTISGNSVGGPPGPFGGGGIAMEGGNNTLTVENSTISGNSATSNFGGGIIVKDGASATIRNCTISGNSAGNGGGGFFLYSSGNNISSLTIENSTISGNAAGFGGGIVEFFGGTITLRSTIVAGNTVDATGASPDISGEVMATDSLVQDPTGTTFAPGSANNITGVDPLLGPLQFNGGPTQTHALLPGSPAIDHGSNPTGFTFDQRGRPFLRVFGPAADIGAFEVVQGPVPFPPQSVQSAIQAVQILQQSGARLVGAAIGEVNGDFFNDIVLAFRLRNSKLLIVTFDGFTSEVAGVFFPFGVPLAAGARVRLVTLDLVGDATQEIVLLVSDGGPGVRRLSIFTAVGVRIL